MITAGPSKGKPETNIICYIAGKKPDVALSMAFRSIPSAEEVGQWRKFLAQSTLTSP